MSSWLEEKKTGEFFFFLWVLWFFLGGLVLVSSDNYVPLHSNFALSNSVLSDLILYLCFKIEETTRLYFTLWLEKFHVKSIIPLQMYKNDMVILCSIPVFRIDIQTNTRHFQTLFSVRGLQ